MTQLQSVARIYIDSLVRENFSHRISRCHHRMPAEFFFASHFTNSDKDGKVFASLSCNR